MHYTWTRDHMCGDPVNTFRHLFLTDVAINRLRVHHLNRTEGNEVVRNALLCTQQSLGSVYT